MFTWLRGTQPPGGNVMRSPRGYAGRLAVLTTAIPAVGGVAGELGRYESGETGQIDEVADVYQGLSNRILLCVRHCRSLSRALGGGLVARAGAGDQARQIGGAEFVPRVL